MKTNLTLLFLSASLLACSSPEGVTLTDHSPRSLKLLIPVSGTTQTGQPLNVMVAAQAPVGDVPRLESGPLPDGATLSDRGDGTALFSWTPVTTQVGEHVILLKANSARETVQDNWPIQVKQGEPSRENDADIDEDDGKADADPDVDEGVNHAPTWGAPTELWVFTGYATPISISPADADGDTVTVSLIAPPAGVTLLTMPYRLSLNILTPGAHQVRVELNDGTVTTAYSIWVHAQDMGNFAPVIAPVASELTIPGGIAWTLPVSFSDANPGDLVNLSVSGPSGMGILLNSAVTWTPPHHGFGSTIITLGASDGMTTTTRQLTLHVEEAANTAPVVNGIPTVTAFQGGLVHFSAPALDPQGDPVTFYSVSVSTASLGKLGGISISPAGDVSWRVPPSFPVGLIYITIVAADSFGAVGSGQKAGVVNLNAAPVISAGPVAQATRGIPWSFTVSASDSDIEAVSLEVITGPTGMTPSLSGSPLQLAWTPFGISGQIPLGIVARDTHGAQTFWTTTITVINRSPLMAVTFPPGKACLGRPLTFGIDGSDADGDVLTYAGNLNDMHFTGAPVTAGIAAFSDYTAPPKVHVGVTVQDGFGGYDFDTTSYQTFGWRSSVHVPNPISSGAGFKFALAAPVFNGANVTGESLIAWQDYDNTAVGTYTHNDIQVQRLDAQGCPLWASPATADAYLQTKKLGAITSSPYSAIVAYTVSDTNTNPPCGNNLNTVQLASLRLDTGATTRVCVQGHISSEVPDPATLKFGGKPEDAIKLVCYGYTNYNYRLACLGFEVLSNGAIVNKSWQDRINIYHGSYAIAENAPGGFFIFYQSSAPCSSGTVCALSMKVSKTNGAILIGPTELTATGGVYNPAAVAFDDGTAIYTFIQGTNVWAKSQLSNGSPGGSFTLDAAGSKNDSMVAKPGTHTVFASWTAGNQIKVRSLVYDVGTSTISSPWGSVMLSAGGVNRNSRIFVLPASLAVAWEERDATETTQYRPMVRFLDPDTGAFLTDPMSLSSIATTAINSFLPLNTGVGSTFIDFSADTLHGDVAAAYRGQGGESRP